MLWGVLCLTLVFIVKKQNSFLMFLAKMILLDCHGCVSKVCFFPLRSLHKHMPKMSLIFGESLQNIVYLEMIFKHILTWTHLALMMFLIINIKHHCPIYWFLNIDKNPTMEYNCSLCWSLSIFYLLLFYISTGFSSL